MAALETETIFGNVDCFSSGCPPSHTGVEKMSSKRIETKSARGRVCHVSKLQRRWSTLGRLLSGESNHQQRRFKAFPVSRGGRLSGRIPLYRHVPIWLAPLLLQQRRRLNYFICGTRQMLPKNLEKHTSLGSMMKPAPIVPVENLNSCPRVDVVPLAERLGLGKRKRKIDRCGC